MMHLFFNAKDEIDDISHSIFNCLGLNNVIEGDSSNVLAGVYYCCNVFGAQIKLEYNSYDWDDVYNYMITIKNDVLIKPDIDDNICQKLREIVVEILSKNLNLPIAVELENGELDVIA